jgi:hypothetical protein
MLLVSDASELSQSVFWTCIHADKMGHHEIYLVCHMTKTYVLALPELLQREKGLLP